MANVKVTFAKPEAIYKEITRQARGKRIPVKCPNCGIENLIDAADIMTGGKTVACTDCALVFKLEGPKLPN